MGEKMVPKFSVIRITMVTSIFLRRAPRLVHGGVQLDKKGKSDKDFFERHLMGASLFECLDLLPHLSTFGLTLRKSPLQTAYE